MTQVTNNLDIWSFEIASDDLWHQQKHEVPKQVTYNPMDGKTYYIDIRAQRLYQIDSDNINHWSFNYPITSVAVNQDGSLILAIGDYICYWREDPETHRSDILKIAKIPCMDTGKIRPNNGNIIPIQIGHEIRNMYFLGTAALAPAKLEEGETPSALHYLDPKTLKLVTIAEGLITCNSVAGIPWHPEGSHEIASTTNTVTFSDSDKSVAELHIARFYPNQPDPMKKLEYYNKIDFKGSGGRPDGASVVEVLDAETNNWEMCLAVAAIDSNEIRFIGIHSGKLLAVGTLPPQVVMPTMPTFFQQEDTLGMITTTLEPVDKNIEGAGNIYYSELPLDKFRQPELARGLASYPSWDRAKAMLEKVNPAVGQGLGTGKAA
jgi:sugar lactone lactonase YvrE